MAFKQCPILFEQWGSTLAVVAGVGWFVIVFLLVHYSLISYGTPWMGFMRRVLLV
jgi:hypothetical protein